MRSPEERENTLRRSLSQSDGDSYKMADGMDPNSEVQQRAMQRYHKLLQTDKQLQVCFPVTFLPFTHAIFDDLSEGPRCDSVHHCWVSAGIA